VRTREYQRALLRILRSDAADLVEALGLESTLDDLALRLEYPEERSAAGRLTRGILDKAGAASPLGLDAREFNLCAEAYYREDLRRRQMEEGLQVLVEDLRMLDRRAVTVGQAGGVRTAAGERGSAAFVASVRDDILWERASLEDVQRLVTLVVFSVHHDTKEAERYLHAPAPVAASAPSIHRAA
jgi:hypothetical protein